MKNVINVCIDCFFFLLLTSKHSGAAPCVYGQLVQSGVPTAGMWGDRCDRGGAFKSPPAEVHFLVLSFSSAGCHHARGDQLCVCLQTGSVGGAPSATLVPPPRLQRLSPDWSLRKWWGRRFSLTSPRQPTVNVWRQLQEWLEVRGYFGRIGRVGSGRVEGSAGRVWILANCCCWTLALIPLPWAVAYLYREHGVAFQSDPFQTEKKKKSKNQRRLQVLRAGPTTTHGPIVASEAFSSSTSAELQEITFPNSCISSMY